MSATTELDPATINPLIQDNLADTIDTVNAVLAFIAGWAEGTADDGEAFPLPHAEQGLSMILRTCQAALEHHAQAERGTP